LKTLRRVRPSEWIAIGYFTYVAALSPFFPLPSGIAAWPLLLAVAVFVLIVVLATPEEPDNKPAPFSIARDWVALALILIAYHEMNWFTPAVRDYHLELGWIRFDRLLLDRWGLRAAIESLGPLIPMYLEACYLLVYAVGSFSVAALYFAHHRTRVDRFLVIYLTGCLLAYALFPFFPSEPPRVVFPGTDSPHYLSPIRALNLSLVNGYGIHSSVFPSAHVSSAFAAAWGLMAVMPKRPWIGRGMLIYAISVAIATVYGRYHYAVDALAGFGVSLAPLAIAWWMRRK
jgi:membrane-associated phospholipid phosphatase